MAELIVSILIVEDDATHAKAISRALAEAGGLYRIETASSLGEFRTKLARILPDLVIADLNLPDGKAFDILAQAHEFNRYPVLAMTALGDEESVIRAMKAGALDHIVKSEQAFRDMPHIVKRALREWRLMQDHQQTEKALLFKTMLLEIQSETSLDGILAVDNEGHSILINKRFGELWKIPQPILNTNSDAKMLEYVLNQLKDPSEFGKKVAYLYAHKDEKSMDEIEFSDGRCFERYSAPMLSADGQLHGRIWFFRDITERKRAEDEHRRYQEQLRAMASELEMADERHRRTIASEIHDGLGQLLTIAKLQLQKMRIDLPPSSQAECDSILERVNQAIEDGHTLIFALSPPILYDLGLEPAVDWLTQQYRQRHPDTRFDFSSDKIAAPLSEDMRIILFRAVRELLFNVVKYAQARHAQVRIRKVEDCIRVSVIDDGIGFRPSTEANGKSKAAGFGLFSIRERMRHLGGSFEIRSGPDGGTEAILIAPIRADTKAG